MQDGGFAGSQCALLIISPWLTQMVQVGSEVLAHIPCLHLPGCSRISWVTVTLSQQSLHNSLHLNMPSHMKHPEDSFPWGHTCRSQYQWNQWCNQPLPWNEIEHICSIFILYLNFHYESLMFLRSSLPTPPPPVFSTQRHFSPIQPFNSLLTVVPKPLFTLPIPTHSPPNSPSRGRLYYWSASPCTSLTAAPSTHGCPLISWFIWGFKWAIIILPWWRQ